MDAIAVALLLLLLLLARRTVLDPMECWGYRLWMVMLMAVIVIPLFFDIQSAATCFAHFSGQ